MKQKYCQSCGMPLSEGFYGTEQNSEKSLEYCSYCYENGAFKQPNLSMEEMIDMCIPFMKQNGMDEDKARALMESSLPALKRWRRSKISSKILELNEMIIVGKEIRTTNEGAQCKLPIQKLWAEFMEQKLGDKIHGKVNGNELLGLYSDYENKEFGMYSYIVGFQVKDKNNIPAGMTVKVIPKSKYNVITVKGNMPQSIAEGWGYIWNSDIERTYTGDFEVYGKKYAENQNSEANIYAAIK
ncbi:zinc ribbon domain-containing protein [Clostridium sp. JN-1]|uniref:effector binding domain-containing protein n=1 Tax=Clostridium sp. JN-1 TaxID=2483110 RepID=UPI000F0B27B0|nr:zinc ribbon domain-containing protein [Clostridium sp. JN-1]